MILQVRLSILGAVVAFCIFAAFPQQAELYIPTGHSTPVNSIAFTPDGKTLASVSLDRNIKIWDVGSGAELATLIGHGDALLKVSFNADGSILFSGDRRGEIRMWSRDQNGSWKELRSLNLKGLLLGAIAFSSRGDVAASADALGTIKISDLSTGKELKSWTGHELLTEVALSPDGQRVAGVSYDNTIRLFDVRTGAELRTFKLDSWVLRVAFDPGGTMLAVACAAGVKLWNVASGIEKALAGNAAAARSVAFSPDGHLLASGDAKGAVRIWSVSSGVEIKTITGHLQSVTAIAFAPDGTALAGGGKSIKLWNLESGAEIKSLRSFSNSAETSKFSPDGKLLAVGGYEGFIQLWDLISGETRILEGHASAIRSVAFSPDGRILASGSFDKTIKLWDLASGVALKSLSGHTGAIGSVAFSADGKILASGSDDTTIKLWDLASGSELKTLIGHKGSVGSISFGPNGKTLASGGPLWDYAKLWDIDSGTETQVFRGASGESLSFSPDGKILATKGISVGAIQLWDVASGWPLKTLKGDPFAVQSILFSPDGNFIAAGNRDKTVHLWDPTSGKRLKVLTGHTSDVRSIAFTPDGKTLSSGSVDGTVKLWELPTGINIASLIALDKKDWIVTTLDGRFDGSADGMKLISYKQDGKLLPLDSFFEQFFTPNLLQKVYAGEKLPPIKSRIDFSKRIRLPPLVRITSPTPGSESNSDMARITVEATDQGGGAEDIRLFHNGKRLDEATRQLTQDAKSNTRTFEVSLLPGINTFRATAFNNDRTEAIPDEIKIELKRVEASANLYILAVGLNEYKNTRYNLNYGNADAKAFADAVEAKGKNIFKEIKKKVLFDAEASQMRIRAEMESIAKQARPQDVFVFFFAGHGKMSEPDVGKAADFFLAPYEVVSLTGDGGSLVTTGISATELGEVSRRISARKQLIVIDACESEGAVATFDRMRGPEEEKAIQQLARSAGVVVLASAGQNQFATEFKTLGHGVFTYALLKGLNGEADGTPKDGKVTVGELRSYIEEQVPELSRIHRGKPQFPNAYIRGNDFPIGVR